MAPVKKLWRYAREEGWYSALQRVTSAKGFPRRVLFVKHVKLLVLESLNLGGIGRRLADYELGIADEGMLDKVIECNTEDDPARLHDTFGRFFSEGHLCCVARHRDGRVIGYAWAFRGAYELVFDETRAEGIIVDLPKDVVFCGNAYVRSDHRLKGVFGQLAEFRIRQFPSRSRFLISVDYWNTRSLKSNLRLGYRQICSVIGLTVLGVSVYLRSGSGMRPWLSFGRSRVQMPCPRV